MKFVTNLVKVMLIKFCKKNIVVHALLLGHGYSRSWTGLKK
jgi:hypothetical protein